MITSKRRGQRKAPPTFKRLSLNAWTDGVQSTLDANRTSEKGLRASTNQILKQNGTLADRPSLIRYGTQPVGTILGEVTEFTKRTTTTSLNYEISLQNVNGITQAYYRKDGGAWTLAPGKTFNSTARAHFCPIRDIDANYNDEDKVLILNGQDNLSYLDINTFTVVPFVTLPTPAAPTLNVGSAITGANFPNRYKVTAGNRGETAASTPAVVQTTKLRSEWSGANEYIDVVISRVTGAKKYHIYYGTETNAETYLFTVDDPGTGSTVTWRDTGVVDPNTFRPAPVGDTTAGPIGTRASFINGQVFIVGDKNNPKYVRYGGTGLSILDFSPYGGGGYEPVGGNKEIPVKVASFRANGGNPAITVLCKGTNGFGKRYILTPATVGNVSYFAISEENGNDGTEAPDSVILAKDQLWYLSRDGGKTTLTKAQVQTILSTEGVTDSIEASIKQLNTQTLDLSVGLTYENRLYWAVAAGSTKNNQIWVLDLNNMRKGAWLLPWNISADWMWLYNDNNGLTHFCILQNNVILEFTESVSTQDDGKAFSTSMTTGLLKFSDDGQVWAEVHRVIFVVGQPQGVINVEVSGRTEDSLMTPLGSGTEPYSSKNDVAGWSEAEWGALAWSEIGAVSDDFGIERTEIEVEIDEEVNYLSCSLNTLVPNSSYELTDIIVEYLETGIKE